MNILKNRQSIVKILTLGLFLALVTGCGGIKGETKDMGKQIKKQNKVLVAYFSASGNTEKVAKSLAGVLGADVFKIEPQEPYTNADLDYNNKSSRVCKEHDEGTEPPIRQKVQNMGQYDVVVLGYPIWWGEAPGVVNTFLKGHDFVQKTIVPFCTSGGSGFGASGKKLAKYASKATWTSGGQLNTGASAMELKDWLQKQGLNVK